MEIFLSLLIIVISAVIIWRSTDGFELASDFLGRRLTKGIKGATINAVASSMPEFLSTIFFLFYVKDVNGFSGGLGIAGGSAIFNILIIPIAIYKNLQWWHGALLTAPYLGYLAYLFFTHKKVADKNENFEYQQKAKKICLKDFLILNLEKIVLRGKMIRVTNAWVLLIVSVLVMVAGTWMLVYATDRLGEELGIPILFVAVILSAAASSIPDTIISIRDARKGNFEDAFSNALGSNIFDISFALGFPLFLYTLLYGPIKMDPDISIASSGIWLALLVVTGATVLIFLIGKQLNLFKTLLLLLLYIGFLIFIVHP